MIRKKWRLLTTIAFTTLMLASLLGGSVNAGSGGVIVENIPPMISSLHFYAEYGVTMVEIAVSDDNSWNDIYCVCLQFFSNGQEISNISYIQYSNRSDLGSMENLFKETKGNYLIYDKSTVEKVRDAKDVQEKCTLTLRFALRPIKASYAKVRVEDLPGMNATVIVEYPLVVSGTALPESPVPTGDISFMIALVSTAFAIKLKYSRKEED